MFVEVEHQWVMLSNLKKVGNRKGRSHVVLDGMRSGGVRVSTQIQSTAYFHDEFHTDLSPPISLILVSAIPVKDMVFDRHVALALPLHR